MISHRTSFPRKQESIIAATLIFTACLCIGFWIARHKPLWTDEIYSQSASIQNISLLDQFSGHIPEGGNSPLFYSLQKLFIKINPFPIPSQILLRINPVIFMSLSVSLIFYYFCRGYSWAAGLLSLFIFMSSHMLWAFWAEARPYALLVFLTTVQSVVFLEEGSWVLLAVTNILLSLTSILSLGEILAVSVLWGALKDRDWKKYIFMTMVPIAIILFYYAQAPKYSFHFGPSRPIDLIHDNVSTQCFYVFFIFFISLLVYFGGQRIKLFKNTLSKEILESVPYFIFMVLVLASSAVVLGLFALHAKQGPQGFDITSRYFIYLTPIGVVTTTILTVSLFKSLSKYQLMQWVLISLIGFFLTQHFFKIVPKAIHSIVSG